MDNSRAIPRQGGTVTAPKVRVSPKDFERERLTTAVPVAPVPVKLKTVSAKPRTAVLTPMGLLAMAVALGIVVFALITHIQLGQVTAGSLQLRKDLSQAKAEQSRLQLNHELAFSLTELEQEAAARYGMKKADARHITYLTRSGTENIITLKTEPNASDGILGAITDLLNTVSGK
ncbi:MAG: hypothetical protein LBM98_12065 [Oscillospiraceae bacterium]|jgi:uncharacterized protein HemX|nr:hypothetical protein [Oscillospiraceae bacterium]